MNFSIETAALTAASSMGLTAIAFYYLSKLIPETPALKWWAISFGAITIDYLMVFFLPYDKFGLLIPLWEAVHATFVSGLLIGILYFLNRKISFILIGILWIIIVVWGVFSVIVKPDFFYQTIPATLIASGMIFYSGWILLTYIPVSQEPGYRFAGLAFILWGFNRLSFSFLELIPWFTPFGYIIAQLTAMAMGIGLIISVLERQRHRAILSEAQVKKTTQKAKKELEHRVNERTAELKITEENLRTTLNSIGDAVIATNVEGNIVRMNPVAENLTGWQKNEARGKPLTEVFNIINTKTRASVENPVSKVLESGKIVGLANHTMLVSKDGTEYQIADSGAPIHDSKGKISGIVLVFRNVTEEYKMREALRENEQRYRIIMEASLQGVYQVDAMGCIVFANPELSDLTGYSLTELYGLSLDILIPTGTNKDISDGNIAVLASGKPIVGENAMVHKNGRQIEIYFCCSPVVDESGAYKGFVGSILDITKQKQAEKKIQTSNSLLSSIIESPDNIIIFALDTNYNYLSFNNAHVIEMKKVYGADIEIGQSVFSYVPRKDDRLKAERSYKRVLKGERIIEIQKFGEADSRFWYELIFNPIINTSNQVTGFTAFITNITERKRIESELKQSTHDIGERIKELKCLYAISTLLEDPEISMEEIFQSVAEFIPPAWQYPEITCSRIIIEDNQYKTGNFKESNWKQSHKILVYGEQEGTIEVYYLEERPEMDEGPFLKEEKDLINAIAERIGRTIERKKAEEKNKKLETQLHQSQRMESIGTLAGGIAHDFNNILFPIVGHTEMLLEDIPENSEFRESLNHIYTGAMRASELVKQILTFSRQDSNVLKLMKMQPIIKEVLKLIRSTIPTTIDIKQNIQSDCGAIKADPIQIHQIVMNLSTNAYHAMEDTGGELVVKLKEIELGVLDLINQDMSSGAYACLTIVDTGKGMNKTLTNKIFDPFFTTKEQGKGTGMGLSVVHGIVKSMNGTIQVYSEPGKGTEFKVYLPVLKSSSEKIEVHQMKEPIQGGIEQILVVDDEEAIITMEKLMLERLGYQVTSRTSSIDALEAFRANPNKFDLVITDMQMPNMSGEKLAVELTNIRPDIPVLLCTGFSETMSDEEAKSLGIKDFLLKPIVVKDLAQKIRAVLDDKG